MRPHGAGNVVEVRKTKSYTVQFTLSMEEMNQKVVGYMVLVGGQFPGNEHARIPCKW